MILNPYHIFDGTSKIIDLSKMDVEIKKLISLLLLYYLYNYPLRDAILVIEEAQNFITPRRIEEEPSVGERMIAELRKFNIGIIMIAHHPSQLPSNIINDAYSIISLSKRSHPFKITDEKLSKKLLFYENGAKVKALR